LIGLAHPDGFRWCQCFSQGEIVEQTFNMTVLDTLDLRHLPGVLNMANEFWKQVLQEPQISDGFKKVTRRHLDVISHFSR
jgi:hypothetical protein